MHALHNRLSCLFFQGESYNPLKPDKQQLETFREYRLRVLIMARVLVELAFYLVFAWALMVICYGRRDTGHYWMTNGIDELLPKFHKVTPCKIGISHINCLREKVTNQSTEAYETRISYFLTWYVFLPTFLLT